MQLPSALLSIPGHHPPTLCYPGHLIGRIAAARLRVHHPAVSEAHALLSLRDGALWLLALRRPLQVDGRAEWQVPLRTGATVPLADGVALVVHHAFGSAEQLGVSIDGAPAVALAGEAWAVVDEGGVAVLRGPEAASPLLRLWLTDGELWAAAAGDAAHAVEPGGSLQVGTHVVTVVILPTRSTAWTSVVARRPPTRVRVSPRLAVVEDDQGGRAELTGNAAVALWAVATWVEVEREQAAPWTVVASALWGARQAAGMRDNLRNNVLYRLDQRLRATGLRDDLLCRDDGLLWFADGVEVVRIGETEGSR